MIHDSEYFRLLVGNDIEVQLSIEELYPWIGFRRSDQNDVGLLQVFESKVAGIHHRRLPVPDFGAQQNAADSLQVHNARQAATCYRRQLSGSHYGLCLW